MDTNKPPKNNKRTRPNDNDTDSDSETCASTPEWPRFLVVQFTDPETPLSKLSPFAIQKAIEGIAGEPKSVRRLGFANLLIEVAKKSHCDNLLAAKQFAGVAVSISPHRNLNTKKGVVRCPDLAGCSEYELLEELKSQKVVDVKRIKVKRDRELMNTNTLILTFGASQLPNYIKAGYIIARVEMYIPNPLRCFKCQKYGHGKDRCKHEQTCARCGEKGHEDTGCENLAHCVNCNGDHPSYARKCPTWEIEREIVKIKYTEDISFPEARRKLQSKSQNGPSYANVTRGSSSKPSTTCQETQTNITWPIDKDKFDILPDMHKFFGEIQYLNNQKPVMRTASTSTDTSGPSLETPNQSGKSKKQLSSKSQNKSSNSPKPSTEISSKASKTTIPPRSAAQAPKVPNQKSDRERKATKDVIAMHNKFSSLETMDTSDPPEEQTKSRSRSPVKAPNKVPNK